MALGFHVAAVCGVGEPGDTGVLAGLSRHLWTGSILEEDGIAFQSVPVSLVDDKVWYLAGGDLGRLSHFLECPEASISELTSDGLKRSADRQSPLEGKFLGEETSIVAEATRKAEENSLRAQETKKQV